MRHHSMLKFKGTNDATKIVGSLVIGTAVGMAVGALMAPRGGAETRRKIVDKGKDLYSSVKDEIRSFVHKDGEEIADKMHEYGVDMREQVESGAEEARNKAEEYTDEAKRKLDEELG